MESAECLYPQRYDSLVGECTSMCVCACVPFPKDLLVKSPLKAEEI